MSAQVPIGIGPPVLLTIPVTAQAGTVDLRTVTAANLKVQKSDGNTVVWNADISNSAISSLTVTHEFQFSDCDVDGVYQVAPQLTVPGGTVPCYAVPLVVTSPYRGAP